MCGLHAFTVMEWRSYICHWCGVAQKLGHPVWNSEYLQLCVTQHGLNILSVSILTLWTHRFLYGDWQHHHMLQKEWNLVNHFTFTFTFPRPGAKESALLEQTKSLLWCHFAVWQILVNGNITWLWPVTLLM